MLPPLHVSPLIRPSSEGLYISTCKAFSNLLSSPFILDTTTTTTTTTTTAAAAAAATTTTTNNNNNNNNNKVS
jgi:hypothetical protein